MLPLGAFVALFGLTSDIAQATFFWEVFTLFSKVHTPAT